MLSDGLVVKLIEMAKSGSISAMNFIFSEVYLSVNYNGSRAKGSTLLYLQSFESKP